MCLRAWADGAPLSLDATEQPAIAMRNLRITLRLPVHKAVAQVLDEHYPATLAVDAIVEAVSTRIGEPHGAVDTAVMAMLEELLILGERHDAQKALETGIAWKVVPDDTLLDEARRLALAIADRPAGAVADVKRAINDGFHSSLEDAMAQETAATVRGFLSPAAQAKAKGF